MKCLYGIQKHSDKYTKKQYNICQLWITVTIKKISKIK